MIATEQLRINDPRDDASLAMDQTNRLDLAFVERDPFAIPSCPGTNRRSHAPASVLFASTASKSLEKLLLAAARSGAGSNVGL